MSIESSGGGCASLLSPSIVDRVFVNECSLVGLYLLLLLAFMFHI